MSNRIKWHTIHTFCGEAFFFGRKPFQFNLFRLLRLFIENTVAVNISNDITIKMETVEHVTIVLLLLFVLRTRRKEEIMSINKVRSSEKALA